MNSLAVRRGQWSSYTRFAAACTVAIVGLSGFWRLPYLLEVYGGGAFLIIYVLALVTLGLPLLSGQILLARGTGADLPGVMARWIRESRHWRIWVWCGALGVVSAALLLACYSVIASWSMAYGLRAVTGSLDHLDLSQARALFYELGRDAEKGFGWQLIFFGLTVAAARQGLRSGIEPVMRTLALLIVVVFAVLLAEVLWHADVALATQSLLKPDFSALTWRGALEALYQAFFTLSLGTGVVVALSGYLPQHAPVVRLATAVLVLDLVVTLAGAFVVSILLRGSSVFLGSGLESLFVVLPAVLDARWQVTLIYTLISLVALAAAVGLLEPLARVLQCRLRITRTRACLYAGISVWVVGLVGLLAFGVLDGVRWRGLNLFGWLLEIMTNVVLPVMGLVYCLFLGRALSRQRLARAWGTAPDQTGYRGFVVWHGALRYPTRVALIVVLFYSLGGLAFVKWLWGS